MAAVCEAGSRRGRGRGDNEGWAGGWMLSICRVDGLGRRREDRGPATQHEHEHERTRGG
jgi:hypothetical protein